MGAVVGPTARPLCGGGVDGMEGMPDDAGVVDDAIVEGPRLRLSRTEEGGAL